MKRVVAIAVIMAIGTTLFSFSVFADTAVQPLQVVTYSDTSTNVRIVGTAERLHYQVDSFQVVFMNPPNNYGTACTPILVSFRFFNASDTPAYVGQPEFEIMASSSTGSVNTTIYGYDQISTDLFIAESTYSTSEVGRIGIGASNDFAYYTGFVIPPRTSLYFSAIVYVNASAYEGVSTASGSQESVNQITMSSLNLYTNQISFSNDYPYYNQPIDFTDIIDAIGELSENVSTSSEMQELIELLTYSGSSYSENNSSAAYVLISDEINIDNISTRLGRIIGNSYILNRDFEIENSNDVIISNATYVVPVIYWFTITNDTDNTLRLPAIVAINNTLPSGSYSYEINTMDSISFYDLHFNPGDISSATYRRSYFSLNNADTTYSYVPPHSKVAITFSLNIFCNNPNDVTWHTVSTRYTVSPSLRNTNGKPTSIFGLLYDIYTSLTTDSNNDNTDEAEVMNDEIHQAEQVWYDNNSEALEQVGLSNYRFNNNQSSGIYQAVTQFQAVWNALGQWTNVYIFILILSISTYIIRHEPTTRVKQYRSSVRAERAERISYYGKKNAEARASGSGSTLKNAIRRRK